MAFDYTPPTIHIPVPKSEGFTVHGLNMDDIARLVTLNLDEIVQMVAYYQEHKKNVFTADGLTQALIILARNFPQLNSEILSVTSDGWGTPSQMRQLPAGVQMAALSHILKLTIEDLGGLGNSIGLFVATVRGALRAADSRTALKTRLLDSVMGFDDKSGSSTPKDTSTQTATQ